MACIKFAILPYILVFSYTTTVMWIFFGHSHRRGGGRKVCCKLCTYEVTHMKWCGLQIICTSTPPPHFRSCFLFLVLVAVSVLMGSVSDYCAHNVNCPMVIVRPKNQ